MKDYSEFLTAEKLALEEVHWAVGMHNPKMAELVTKVCEDHGLLTVIVAADGCRPTCLSSLSTPA